MVRSAVSGRLPAAPQALYDILDGKRGSVQSPIRSEIFGVERFRQHGRSLGQTHRAARMSIRAATFFPRLKNNIQTLREAHHYIGVQASTGYDISPAAEWLLDNFHTIEAQLKEIHDGLPRSFFRTLPMLLDPPLAGLPRIYGVAWAFVAHTDGAFDEELLAQFLTAYQEARELKLNEVWALPTTLRVVLIENLRRLAERVATNKAARELANLCFDRIEDYDGDALDHLLNLMTLRGVGPVFLAQMAQRLQDRRAAGDDTNQASIQGWLRSALPDLGALQTQQRAEQAQDNLSVSNAVTSLRAIGDADWSSIIARTSSLMQLMLTSEVFAAEDDPTRDQTLHAIEKLARRSGLSEVFVAQSLLNLMHTASSREDVAAVAHHWLRGAGQKALMTALGLHQRLGFFWQEGVRRLALPAYLLILTGALSLLVWTLIRHGVDGGGAGTPAWLMALGVVAAVFPASEAVVAVINRLISESARPVHLPRLALVDGIPAEHRVVVVIPGMLTGSASASDLAHRLELHYLANPEHDAQFALLTDWADADTPQIEADAALLDQAQQHLQDLNQRYPRGPDDANTALRFILLHRERTFSPSEQRWIGWERKRGKLEQLVAALATGTSSAFLDLGARSRLASNVKYVVTLDSDTQLPPGRLRELVGIAAHPHNQPRLDAGGRFVASGYGILQPRIATPLPMATDVTPYHWLFAGQCGIDPYSAASSEVYQDLFSEGTFTGKGLLHVQAVHAVLTDRLPVGQILSHDLLEGSVARCAAVTDITVIEEAPFHADVAASRVHRWTRGDWQLLPVLLTALLHPGRYGIRAVNLWKMVDNLRRSLVAPMSLVLLVLALAGAVMSPWVALVLVYLAFSAGALMGSLAGFSPHRYDLAKGHFFAEAAMDLARGLCGGLWHVAQLLQQSLLAVDAIVRALYRMAFSRRQLLQWTTAAVAQSQARTELKAVARLHWIEPLVALLVLIALLLMGTPHPALALAVCLLWAGSPIWTWWVSRPRAVAVAAEIPAHDLVYLEGIARDTWRLFERCVGPQDNHLPPDNLQLTPHDMVAHRTSPTNMGLYLLSACCARQFGWIGTQDLLARLEATLATLHTLQRHRGHFLNWYDTQTCAPLMPMYVSTVDSGNLVGHLLAVAQACLELAATPFDATASQRATVASRNRLAPLLAGRSGLPPAQREELRWLLADHRALLQSVALDQHAGQAAARERLHALARAYTDLAWQADFSFLYHRKRHLFHIGYRVAELQRDAGFYDLMASESRLTSLLAIAKGDVPVRHWASLGRPFFAVGRSVGLRSWTGSMFEYLMPSLVLAEPPGSVLQAACDAALREQALFARTQGLPWGISESAYAASDETLAYQYAPQGVPRLALRRTPPDELVIAPYATALAALIAPRLAVENFRTLEGLGARGRYGFVEALDYTPARQVSGSDRPFSLVNTVMAHHQGMSIVSLAHVLLGAPAQRWGMANAPLEAVASLLHERVPREVSVLYAPRADVRPLARQRRRSPGLLREVLPGLTAVEPTHLLSNGRYSVALRANGAGWSRWGQTGITRQRDDALRDDRGSFFYVRRDPLSSPVSLTQHPAPDPDATYQSVYHADRVCFDAAWADLHAQTTVWVSPEDDIEFRSVELRNVSDRTLHIELISAFEVTLADRLADEAHPAFTNLFVRAQWLNRHQALLFERKPRLPSEQGVQLAHFLTTSDPRVLGTRIQTDRQRWLGRNHCPASPLASLDPVPGPSNQASKLLDTGLDPFCALAVQLRIAPMARIQLTFATAVSDNAETLHAVIDKYRQPNNVRRASLMSATLTSIRLRALRINAENFSAMQSLTTALVLSLTRMPMRAPDAPNSKAGVCDRRLLWRFGISGDRPLILVSAGAAQGVGMLRALAQLLNLWSWGGVACDLVVVNSEPVSYVMALHREIEALRERHVLDAARQTRAPCTGFYLLRSDALSVDELSTLKALARFRLYADGRPLAHHVQDWMDLHAIAWATLQEAPRATMVHHSPRAGSAVSAPVGRFSDDGAEFEFAVSTSARPVRPWINVLSNPGFGAQLSEAGSGYTWAINSRLNQLTAWSNDPVADPPAEWFLLQDRRTGETWSAAANAWGARGARYQIRHGQGYSVVSHHHGDLEVRVTWCVDARTSVKQVKLVIINQGQKTQHLRIAAIAEWLMGANRADRNTVQTACHQGRLSEGSPTVLLASQRERAAGFGEGTAFLCMAGPAGPTDDWTCDRREWLDPLGQAVLPDRLGQRSGSGLDPCAAIASPMELAAGASGERVFLLGYAENREAAIQLATLSAAVPPESRMEAVHSLWGQLLGATTVKTPDPLFDAMVNRWLLYQTVTCRLWAKAGFYQAGGATGFRDQLQDAMALAWAAPDMLRAQIVLCASRQFEQGDVQHWWHAPTGAGVRTHFSDDLLWLAYACTHYVRATGDVALLEQRVPFLDGAAIPDGAEDAYYTPTVNTQEASVYEHAARAIDRSLRVGVHGLPLMGSGDWNDGMNRVGIEGRGESVWLGWFLCRLVADFVPLAQARGEVDRTHHWEAALQGWKLALQGPAWDGKWFKRAFFDDGQALGSSANAEARIDLIAQAWSALSGAADTSQQSAALRAMDAQLVDVDHGLIKLLDPPLSLALPSAGYIQAYPPGVRENGGQYSHAGVWALMALAAHARDAGDPPGESDDPYRYFTYLSPAHRASHPSRGPVYGVEPYAMAGDVYTQPPYVGRGGWSWYTGAAAWMHRGAIESIFGLQVDAQELVFHPCLPAHWRRAELTLVRDARTMHFILMRASLGDALDATTPLDAQALRPGQSLRWVDLAAQSCFVIALPVA
ncbi:MAG: glucoamylase family protein [Rhodoferax sp.]|nr:glucoamylase family protein [Rhodoferax sp.]